MPIAEFKGLGLGLGFGFRVGGTLRCVSLSLFAFLYWICVPLRELALSCCLRSWSCRGTLNPA